MSKPIYTIYKVTNTVNGKIYVGYTKRSAAIRWRWHCTSKYPTVLHSAIKKHGASNFIVETIYCSLNGAHTLNVMEGYFITKYNSHYLTGHGYNMTLGGDGNLGYKKTPEECFRMSQRFRGSGNPMYGKTLSAENKLKLSIKFTGAGNPAYGTKLTDEQKRLIGDRHKGRKLSAEHKAKLSQNHYDSSGSNNPMFGKTGIANPSFGKTGFANAASRNYLVKSPDGNEVQITSLRAFCIENGLVYMSMLNTLRTHQPLSKGLHKGWQVLAKLIPALS